jgi:hypothetical protein
MPKEKYPVDTIRCTETIVAVELTVRLPERSHGRSFLGSVEAGARDGMDPVSG